MFSTLDTTIAAGLVGGFFHIIGYIIIGAIVGLIARALLPGRDPMGCLATAVLGIVGSLVGGFIARLILGAKDGREDAVFRPSFIASIIGAVIVLWIWRMIQKRST